MGIMLKNAPLSKMKRASSPLIFVLNIARFPGAMVIGSSDIAIVHLDSPNEAVGRQIPNIEHDST
jgi:hypothetical protein